MAQSPEKPLESRVMALHADSSAADGLQLFNDIAVNEKALISAIENISISQESVSLVLDSITKASSLVLALPLSVIFPLYDTLQDYKAVLEDANRSIAEYKVMTCAEAQDLHDILAAFESIFKASSAPANIRFTPECVSGSGRHVSQDMFRYARDFVISGSQFNNHYVVHNHNSSRKHFVTTEKIFRRLNGLMPFRSAGHNQCSALKSMSPRMV